MVGGKIEGVEGVLLGARLTRLSVTVHQHTFLIRSVASDMGLETVIPQSDRLGRGS